MKLSSHQLRAESNAWRLRIQWIVGIGLFIVFVLAIQGAQAFNILTGTEQFNFGLFLIFFLALGLPVVGFSMPYFMMAQALEGLADATQALGSPGGGRHAQGKAKTLYRRAEKWRNFAKWVAIIVGIGGFIAAINGSRDFYGDMDGGAFLISLITLAIGIGVGLMPYLILTTIMDGIASTIELAERTHRELASANKDLKQSRGIEEVAAPPTNETQATRQRPSPPKPPAPSKTQEQMIEELSVEARRVAGAIGAMGVATRDQVVAKLDLNPGNVYLAISQLVEAGLVRESEPGAFEYVPPSPSEPEPSLPKMVYCVSCRYPISETLVDGPHKGHVIRPT